MDDLAGLDWSASSKPTTSGGISASGSNYYPALRATPSPANSARGTTPLSAESSGAPKASSFAPPKSSTPDSFSNLVSFGSSKNKTTLTLQEQQERLQAEKRKKEENLRNQYDILFQNSGVQNGISYSQPGSVGTPSRSFNNSPSSHTVTPAFTNIAPALNNTSVANANKDDDEDLFAAFNADTKVDNSSHFPPPSLPASGRNTPGFETRKGPDLSKPQAWDLPPRSLANGDLDDDDPFGLKEMNMKGSAGPVSNLQDEDDFLGDLAKPVEEVRRAKDASSTQIAHEVAVEAPESEDPWDKAVSELVDMGFTAEQSRRALIENGGGLDIQSAVSWLLNDAHKQAKQKSQNRGNGSPMPDDDYGESAQPGSRRAGTPAWMRDGSREKSQPRREDSHSPARFQNDLSKTAAAVSSNLFKTANSLWKTSQKKVQQAVAEFQADQDLSQPKWMREAADRETRRETRPSVDGVRGRQGRMESSHSTSGVTNEAIMLEASSGPPSRKSRTKETGVSSPMADHRRNQSPILQDSVQDRPAAAPRWQQTRPAATASDPRSRLTKQVIEEQTAQAYISPARRKKAPAPSLQESEPDLLGTSSRPKESAPRPPPPQNSRPTPAPAPGPSHIPSRPKPSPRPIPSVSTAALNNSTQHRISGTERYKRGDYASAHESYTSSLSELPLNHPITIILFCNRALTSLKNGMPKAAVEDADKALAIIGPGRGEGETIDFGSGATGDKKDMKEFWGKALTRKAEALEQMERWKDAGQVWRECVEAGVGGATAMQGRQRCEKALAPKPVPSSRPAPAKPKPAVQPKSGLSDLAMPKNTEAVERLRAANAAAEKADDEKFALADVVDARISKWKDGRADNLRALLGSLDLVLWESSGWKKVGMHELVVNSKVKIAYMKAIGKTHPDKLPQDASTEVRLIAAAVFASLNESWDKCSKAGIPCVFPPRRGGASQSQNEDELRTRLKSLEKIVQELLRRDESQKNEKAERSDYHGADEESAMVTALSPPESEKSSNVNENFPVLKGGRLVAVDGRSSYLTSSFWVDLNEEVESLRDLMEGLQDDAESSEPLATDPSGTESHTPFAINQGFFFNFSSLAADLQSLMPSPRLVPIYWEAYTTNVNPMLKFLHIPSIKDSFMSAQFSLDGLSRPSQALIFAICFSAVASMSPDGVKSKFGEEKDILFQRLRFAVEQALARANFMGTNELVTLQALVLFLNCICRQDDDSRVLYTMTGVAVRLAQLQGLHRDGTLFGLPPFETEMRRRLWWNICTLDQRAAEEQGSIPLLCEGSFDTKMPLNINDSEISPDSTSFPEPEIGATDMSFALLRIEHWKAYRQFHKSSAIPEQLSQEEAAKSIEEKERLLETIKEHFETTYLRYFDTSVPFFWLVTTFSRLSFEKMALLIYHPFHTTTENPLLPQDVRDRLFVSCTNIIGYTRVVEISPFISQWAWFFRIYVQRNAVAYVLTELCIRPSSKEVDRAWEAIDFVFNWWSPAVKRTTDGVVWRPLKKLLGRALKVREANLSLRSQHLSGTAGTTPSSQTAKIRLQEGFQDRHGKLGSDSQNLLGLEDTGTGDQNSLYGQETIPSKLVLLPQSPFGDLSTLGIDNSFDYTIPPEDIGKYINFYSAEGGFDFDGMDEEEQTMLRDPYF
ncbi:hypothetical protein B7463_g5617, partial [Scytalidium lignicola]